MAELSIGVLVSGRGSNLQAILDAERRGELPGCRVRVVISDNPQAPALDRARERGVSAVALDPGRFPDRRTFYDEMLRELEAHDVRLVCLAGYMRRVPGRVVARYRWRMMNIHPSLLPSFPGLEPQRKALEHGVKVSGCTVHFVDEELDTGPIILQAAVPVYEDDTVSSLSARILEQEHRIYPEAIRLFAADRLQVEGRRVRILPQGGQEK